MSAALDFDAVDSALLAAAFPKEPIMMRRVTMPLFLLTLCLWIPAFGRQTGTASSSNPEGQEAQKKDPFSRFHWLTASGETRGLVFEDRKLESLKVDFGNQPTAETETEVTRPDANSMRTTRRIYDRGPNGERQLVEVAVEELHAAAGEKLSATRTVSRRDANGRMQVALKETQETAPAGTDTYQTRVTTMIPGSNAALAKSEELVQVEKKKADGAVEIDRSQLLPDGNGGWATAGRRVGTARKSDDEIIGQEDVYSRDVNGRLALSQRESSREWKDSQGKEYLDKDTYRVAGGGRLELAARSNLVSVTYSDGSTQTTQSLLQRNQAAPSEGMKLAEKILLTRRPADSRTTESELQVQALDPNGNLQTTYYRKDIEKK